MPLLLHVVSSHRSLASIKQEQVDIILPTTYETYCAWGIMIFIEWCGKNSNFDARLNYLAIAWFRHITFYFCHITFIFCIILDILGNVWTFLLSFLITLTIYFLDILDNVWKVLLLFLITLTIHVLSPRNYSFKTFLTSEEIKEILSQWKKVILSDSVTSH